MVERTMTREEQIKVIEDMVDAVNAHDLDRFASYFSDSVVAHTPQGTLRGPAEVKGLFAARIAERKVEQPVEATHHADAAPSQREPQERDRDLQPPGQ